MTTMNEAHERDKINKAVKCTDKSCSSYNALKPAKCKHETFPYYCDRAKAHKTREAAPELLEACKTVLEQLRELGHYDTIKAANILQEAINKAEGGK
jgi:hypothetical protein